MLHDMYRRLSLDLVSDLHLGGVWTVHKVWYCLLAEVVSFGELGWEDLLPSEFAGHVEGVLGSELGLGFVIGEVHLGHWVLFSVSWEWLLVDVLDFAVWWIRLSLETRALCSTVLNLVKLDSAGDIFLSGSGCCRFAESSIWFFACVTHVIFEAVRLNVQYMIPLRALGILGRPYIWGPHPISWDAVQRACIWCHFAHGADLLEFLFIELDLFFLALSCRNRLVILADFVILKSHACIEIGFYSGLFFNFYGFSWWNWLLVDPYPPLQPQILHRYWFILPQRLRILLAYLLKEILRLLLWCNILHHLVFCLFNHLLSFIVILIAFLTYMIFRVLLLQLPLIFKLLVELPYLLFLHVLGKFLLILVSKTLSNGGKSLTLRKVLLPILHLLFRMVPSCMSRFNHGYNSCSIIGLSDAVQLGWLSDLELRAAAVSVLLLYHKFDWFHAACLLCVFLLRQIRIWRFWSIFFLLWLSFRHRFHLRIIKYILPHLACDRINSIRYFENISSWNIQRSTRSFMLDHHLFWCIYFHRWFLCQGQLLLQFMIQTSYQRLTCSFVWIILVLLHNSGEDGWANFFFHFH